MRLRVVLLAPALVALVAAIWFVPALTREREVIVASPQPPPLFTAAPITFLLNTTACTGPLPVDADTDIAQLRAGRFGTGPGTHFAVTVTAPGYRVRRVFGDDYRDGAPLRLPLPDPPRPLDAKLCVANYGPAAGLLAGSSEGRTRGRMTTILDGKPSDTQLVVTLLADRPSPIADRLGDVGSHIAALKPGFAPPAVLVALGLLVVLGLPLGAALVMRRSASP